MPFKIYAEGKIPEYYSKFDIWIDSEKERLISKYQGKYAVVKDSKIQDEYFEGILKYNDETSFYLINPRRPTTEEEKLTFRFENLEAIFLRNF